MAREVCVQLQFKNVSHSILLDFLVWSEHCEKKRSNKRKGLVVRPIVHSQMNSRAQLDLIDVQTQPDGDFLFIFVCQDHLTKFVQLRLLRHKTSAEVANNLLDVFTIFGAPCILHGDNGRELVNAVVESLKEMWPGLHIVYGKARHSQSRGSVERANRDIEEVRYVDGREEDE